MFSFFAFEVQVSDGYVTTGLIIVLCILTLVFFFRNFDFFFEFCIGIVCFIVFCYSFSNRCLTCKISKFRPRTGCAGPEREKRYSLTLSLTSELEDGEWSKSCPGLITPGKRHGAYGTGGCVGPRVGLDWYGKSRPLSDSIPGSSIS